VVIHGEKPVRIPGKTLKEEWNPLAITSSKGKGLDLSSHSFALKEGTLRKAVYELTLDGGLTVTKSFELAKYDYVVTLDVTFQNASAKLLHVGDHQVRVGTVLPLDLKAGYRNISFMALGAGKVQKFSPKPDKERSKLFSFLRWASAGNKYFALILSPKQGKGKYEVVPQVPKTSGAAVFPGKASSKNERDYCYSLGVAVEGFDLEPGDTIVHRYSFYAGPKEYDRLKRLSRSFTGDPQFEKVMRFGWFGFVGVPLLKVLKGCYGLIPNYGLAIIVLTVLIKIILYPLDQKSYKSMKEMQKVQPLIAELKKKYKDDPRQAQVEQMKLFKEHKVNPLGGCLPMLLQMPVLFAMFQMIRSAVELRGAPFVLWIKDLSQPDAILDFGVEIPIIGHTLNILPLLLVLSFVAQTKISKLGTTAAQQDPQQKMMGHMMTVIFGIIFYNLPSGLTLYFAISTVLRSVQQYYVQKRA
jgi:YidC/Oxa1 family membrane protein insertase